MWAVVLSWVVVGSFFAILISISWEAIGMTPPDFIMAKWCLNLSFLILIARLAWWLAIEQGEETDNFKIVVFAFVLLGFVGALWVGALRWVSGRQTDFSRTAALQELFHPAARPNKETHRTQREALNVLREKGYQLSKDYEAPDDVSGTPAQQWVEKVARYIAETWGDPRAGLFMSNAGIKYSISAPEGASKNNQRIYLFLMIRLIRVEQFIRELRD